MEEMNKINVDELENVAGGATRTVANDAVNYANVRESTQQARRSPRMATSGTRSSAISIRTDGSQAA